MSGLRVVDTAEIAGVEAGEQPDPSVEEALDGKDGRPIGSVRNAVRVLEADARWTGRLRWSTFEDGAFLDGEPLTDHALTRIGLWLDEVYGLRPGADILLRAVLHVAREHSFHPVRDWLDSLRWDGIPRLERMFVDLFGAEDTPLVRQIGRRWLNGAVARVLEPGCKLDTMVVLIGAQGAGKSTACAALLPQRRWFTDTTFDIGSKDAMVQLQGVWLIEIGELQSLRRVSPEAVKTFLSSCCDRFRRPYGRLAEDHPRQCVFVGTTNEEEFLGDPTGARRYWPVRVGRVDLDGILRDRDQLWAEAVVARRAGEQFWLDPEGVEALVALSRGHEIADPWDDVIARWVARQAGVFTVERVLSDALSIPAERMDRSRRTRAGQVLARLGCGQTRPRGTASRARVWTRPATMDQAIAGDEGL